MGSADSWGSYDRQISAAMSQACMHHMTHQSCNSTLKRSWCLFAYPNQCWPSKGFRVRASLTNVGLIPESTQNRLIFALVKEGLSSPSTRLSTSPISPIWKYQRELLPLPWLLRPQMLQRRQHWQQSSMDSIHTRVSSLPRTDFCVESFCMVEIWKNRTLNLQATTF